MAVPLDLPDQVLEVVRPRIEVHARGVDDEDRRQVVVEEEVVVGVVQ